MKVVGVTGGIGAGKTMACRFFREFGAEVFDADKMAHRLTETEPEVIAKIKARFGERCYLPDGRLDRKYLGGLVFSDDELRDALNRIVHPPLIQRIENEIEARRARPAGHLFVVEAALLFEMAIESLFDVVITVHASRRQVLTRIFERDGLTQSNALQRIRAQLPPQYKRDHADIVITNDGDLAELREQTRRVFEQLVAEDC